MTLRTRLERLERQAPPPPAKPACTWQHFVAAVKLDDRELMASLVRAGLERVPAGQDPEDNGFGWMSQLSDEEIMEVTFLLARVGCGTFFDVKRFARGDLLTLFERLLAGLGDGERRQVSEGLKQAEQAYEAECARYL